MTDRRSTGRALTLALVCLALLARPAHAATIQLTIAAQPVVAADGVHVRLDIRNGGDAAARNVLPIVVFRGNETLGTFATTLEPKQSLTQTVVLPLTDAAAVRGTWPFFVRVSYADGNNHPFEGLHIAPVRFDADPPVDAVSLGLSGTRIETTGEINADLTGADGTRLSLVFAVPVGLAVTPADAVVTLGRKRRRITAFVTNAGATAPSSLPVFAVAEYDVGNRHQTSIAMALVQVAEPTAARPAGDRLIVAGLVALATVFLVVVVLRRRRSSPSR